MVGQMNCALCGSIPFGWEHTVRSEAEHVCITPHPVRKDCSIFVRTNLDQFGVFSTEGITGPTGLLVSRKTPSLAMTALEMEIGKNDIAK